MPKKDGRLTPQEKRFAEAYAITGDMRTAAGRAGYRVDCGSGSKALQRPEVQDEIRRIQVARLNNTLLPLAVGALERLLTDAKTPAGAVVQAAKLVLDKTGVGVDLDGAEKAPHEMTGEELSQALARLRREAAERAKPIIDGQAVDVTGHAESGVFD